MLCLRNGGETGWNRLCSVILDKVYDATSIDHLVLQER